ncbi:MAG: hypothetical protein V3V14_13075 [Saprospiraceae bacterium]
MSNNNVHHTIDIPTDIPKVEQGKRTLPSDFYSFYDNFHSDSIFQLDHILFPLQGMGANIDSAGIYPKTWQQETWKLHRAFNNQAGTFERSFTNVNGIITEFISANGGLFSMEKRYTKLNNSWHLIYYKELTMNG